MLKLGDRGRDVLLWERFLVAHGQPLPLHCPDGIHFEVDKLPTQGKVHTALAQITA